MFRVAWSRQTVDASALLLSKLYEEDSFYDAFIEDIKRAKNTILIESPYLTERRALQFSDLFNKKIIEGVRVLIYTRNPQHHDNVLEIQSRKALKILKESGAHIFICDDMRHRKLAIIDNLILWEGSLNILSQSKSCEVMRRSVSSELCNQMINFIKPGCRQC